MKIYDYDGTKMKPFIQNGKYLLDSVKHINVVDDVERIESGAFAYCFAVTSVYIPNSVTSIGEFAFVGCDSLTSINIPDSVTKIEDSAFGECKSLISVIIPNSVTSIGKWAFVMCYSLERITIPNSVTYIGEGAFGACSDLTIKCYKGSYVETYAKENNIPFELID